MIYHLLGQLASLLLFFLKKKRDYFHQVHATVLDSLTGSWLFQSVKILNNPARSQATEFYRPTVMAMGVSSGKLSHKYRPHSHMTRED
jgi:hypothetical protein